MPETAALVIFMRQRIRSRWISGRHVVGRLDEALGMDLACRRRWRGRNVKNGDREGHVWNVALAHICCISALSPLCGCFLSCCWLNKISRPLIRAVCGGSFAITIYSTLHACVLISLYILKYSITLQLRYPVYHAADE
ncbi:hypothetical protein I7I48_10798 [Histoplasma ohiense]|nr:hypothetical protein I7I48_10798 [Histoplasma ohiense (nom. inval.)]